MRKLRKLAGDCGPCRQGFHCGRCLCCLSEEKVAALVQEAQENVSVFKRRPDLADEAKGFAEAALSDSTRRATKADWVVFSTWCATAGVVACPATVETAVAFFTDQARTKKVATLARYRANLGKLHKVSGVASPFGDERVKVVLAGIRRTKGVKQDRKSAMTLDLVVKSSSDDGPLALRDRAVLLFGLNTAFRRSELVGVNVEDLTWVDEGVIVHLGRSKTDQEGAGRFVPIPKAEYAPDLCAVTALRKWMDAAAITSGPVFLGQRPHGAFSNRRLNAKNVAKVVKEAVKASGLDPDRYAGHSLRAGFVTLARQAGFSWAAIMEQTGHKKLETVMRYARDSVTANPFKFSSVASIFKTAWEMRQGRPNAV